MCGHVEYWKLSATDALRKIKSGDISSVGLVQSYIDRITMVDGQLNALVHRFFERALEQAEEADRIRLKAKRLSSLHGMPITIKESLGTPGTPVSLGLEQWQRRMPTDSSVSVDLLCEAGAIVLGKTNVSQMLLFHESDNPLWGPCNNPWDLERVPGGSSGGEAAAIAGGLSPWGMGTDIGGSIRIPAAFCGIAGLKPTVDRWSNIGSHSVVPGQEVIRSQCGPMARTAEDVSTLFCAVDSGLHAQRDPNVPPVKMRDPARVNLKKLRVGVYDHDGFLRPAASVRRGVMEAALALENAGVEVVPYEPTYVEEILYTYLAALSGDGGAHMEEALGGDPLARQLKSLWTVVRLPRQARGLVSRALDVIGERRVGRLVREVRPKTVYELWQLTKRRTEIRRQVMTLWSSIGLDAVVCPVHATPALRHGDSVDFTLGGSYSLRYNFLNLPAGVVPVTRVSKEEEYRNGPHDRLDERAAQIEMRSAGLPVAVQVAAQPFHEDTVLALMMAIENEVKGKNAYPRTPVEPRI